MDSILQFLELDKGKQINVAVVGDIMIDDYYKIEAERISPEFPIPVLQSGNDTPDSVLGGAGNVAEQFVNFNVNIYLFGFIDSAVESCADKRVNIDHCVHTKDSYLVPRKKRFYYDNFPLVRWDVEIKNYGMSNDILREKQLELYDNFAACGVQFDVVVYSDYDKGVFYDRAELWSMHDAGCRKIVDPKRGPSYAWDGCQIFKPNLNESKSMCPVEPIEDRLKIMCGAGGHETIIITCGGEGVYAMHKKEIIRYKSTKSSNARSVVGAGDCFTAFLAMGVARGMDMKDIIQVAYEAGATYVQRPKNRAVSRGELLLRAEGSSAKIVSPEDVFCDGKLIFTNGCFDVLHDGHRAILEFAKSQGDVLVVAVNSDDSVRRIKGEGRPINSLERRMRLIAALEPVDFVVSFDEDTPYEVIKKIQPSVIVKGSDHSMVVGEDLAQVLIFPRIPGLSTTEILSR